jgi:hypothetical protein
MQLKTRAGATNGGGADSDQQDAPALGVNGKGLRQSESDGRDDGRTQAPQADQPKARIHRKLRGSTAGRVADLVHHLRRLLPTVKGCSAPKETAPPSVIRISPPFL